MMCFFEIPYYNKKNQLKYLYYSRILKNKILIISPFTKC